MPRTKSAIVDPAERKTANAELKAKIKEVQASIKEHTAFVKSTLKARNAEDADQAKAHKELVKKRALEDKNDAKERAYFDKQLALLQAELSAIENFPAQTAEPEVRVKRVRRTKAQMEEARAAASA